MTLVFALFCAALLGTARAGNGYRWAGLVYRNGGDNANHVQPLQLDLGEGTISPESDAVLISLLPEDAAKRLYSLSVDHQYRRKHPEHRPFRYSLFTAAGRRVRRVSDLWTMEELTTPWTECDADAGELETETEHAPVPRGLKSLCPGAEPDRLYLVPRYEHFVWPGVRVGHVRRIPLLRGGGEVEWTEMETLAMQPRVFYIDNFINDTEAAHLWELAEPLMEPSGLYGAERDEATRSSDQAWLFHENDPIVDAVSLRSSSLVHLPDYHGSWADVIQVIHYDEGAHYRYHLDWFDRHDYGQRPDLELGRNRFTTTLFYLDDVEAGGETGFPIADEHDATWSGNYFENCESGLTVKPKKGAAVLFYNLKAEGLMLGEGDERALHAGCDVVRGTKKAANLWTYNMQFDGNVDAWLEEGTTGAHEEL